MSVAQNGHEDSVDGSKNQRVIHAELGEMTEMTSMCPRCEHDGKTRLMITKIPHFREVIVSSFECGDPECGERNNEIQFGGQYGEMWSEFELEVKNKKDLDRQIVKSEHATIRIPEVDLEIPPETQRGLLNTVEGFLRQAIEGLQALQPLRKIESPEIAAKIDEFCEKVRQLADGERPFSLILTDPAGNSYIEPLYTYFHPTLDTQLHKTLRPRTDIERQLLGLALEYNSQTRTTAEEAAVDAGELPDVIQIEQECPACRKPGELKMHQCDIPHFKETLIMCFKCDSCGYKSTEIKNGGAISPKGLRLTLRVENESDLKRDVLKSNTALLEVPEIGLELAPGTLGGFFTTIEGLLRKVHDSLEATSSVQFEGGDAAAFDADRHSSTNISMKDFLSKLDKAASGELFPFTVIMDDPLAMVYVQNPRSHLPPPENVDPQLVAESYTRTEEQDEDLGLHQMNCD